MRRLPLALAIALTCGCSRRAALPEPLVGTWKGDPPIPAVLTNDPALKDLVDSVRGSVVLKLFDDHTFSLDLLGTRMGTWSRHNRLLTFSETSVRSGMALLGPDELGARDSSGRRTYSALASEDEKSLTILFGKGKDIELSR